MKPAPAPQLQHVRRIELRDVISILTLTPTSEPVPRVVQHEGVGSRDDESSARRQGLCSPREKPDRRVNVLDYLSRYHELKAFSDRLAHDVVHANVVALSPERSTRRLEYIEPDALPRDAGELAMQPLSALVRRNRVFDRANVEHGVITRKVAQVCSATVDWRSVRGVEQRAVVRDDALRIRVVIYVCPRVPVVRHLTKANAMRLIVVTSGGAL